MSVNSGSGGAQSGMDSVPPDFTEAERAWQATHTWDSDQTPPKDPKDDA